MVEQDKIEKLPKWARDHITHLTHQVNNLTNHVRELSEPDSIEDSDTSLHSYIYPDVKFPKGSLIRFVIDGDEIDVRVERGALEIRSNNGILSISPRVSNVIEVTVKDR